MKTMKTMKMCCALIGAASVISSTSLLADTITLAVGPGGADQGGGFIATTSGGIFGNASFTSFCLERSEHISFGATYNYAVNTGAVNGGLDYSHTLGASSTFDPLSLGTAYIYSQYTLGALNGFMGFSGDTLANAVQNAVWYLENELTSSDPSIPTLALTANASALLNYAVTNGGISSSSLTNNSNGAYGVVALNLTDTAGRHQDMLAVVPEPSTVIAGALLLLPLGVSALRIVRKNRVA